MRHQTNNLPAFEAVADRLKHMRPIQLELTAFEAFTVIGHLQLALRHPGSVGPAAEITQAIASGLQQTLAMQDGAVAEVLDAGWNPDLDVPAGE